MGRNSSDTAITCHSPLVVMCGALSLLITSTVLLLMSFYVLQYPGFDTVALIIENSTVVDEQGFGLRMGTLVTIVLVLSLFMFCSGCIGYGSTQSRSQTGMCFYIASCIVFLLVMLYMCVISTDFSAVLSPIIHTRAESMCNTTLHHIYLAQLDCKFDYQSSAPCDKACEETLVDIRAMGGCKMLSRLCHHYVFDEMPLPGHCVPSGGPSLRTTQSLDQDQTCEHACNQHVSCRGYSENPCTLVFPQTHSQKEAVSITGTDGTSGVTCYTKGSTLMTTTTKRLSVICAWIAGISTVLLFLAVTCALQYQYTLVTGLKGKKGAGSLCLKLMCPCLQRENADRKFGFTNKNDYTSAEDEDSDM